MYDIMEMADGRLILVDYDNLDTFDPNDQTFYSWLNAVEYVGVGRFINLSEADMENVIKYKVNIITEE